jgi:transcriptional regulator with XRE-family HTH domain
METMDKQDKATRGTSMATSVVAENLRRLLDETGMQGKELARRIRVSPQSISQWMTGQLVPTRQRLIQIAQVLQVEADDLTRDIEESNSVTIKRYSLDLSPQTPRNQRLVQSAMQIFLPLDLASSYGCSPPEEMAAIQVKDHNLEPTVWAGDELFVDLSWRAVTLSDLYLLDFAGFPLFRWCNLVAPETVNVSDQRMDQDFPAGDLAVLGRVVGRMSVGSIRR